MSEKNQFQSLKIQQSSLMGKTNTKTRSLDFQQLKPLCSQF